MDLLARHGVSRADLEGAGRNSPVKDLINEVLATGSGWAESATGPVAGTRHLCAVHGLYGRKLGRLRKCAPADYAAEINRIGIIDLVTAWNAARRLNRP